MPKQPTNTHLFAAVSTALVAILQKLAVMLDNTDDLLLQKHIFAAARQVQKSARLSGCLSRFNTAVRADPVASVFSEHQYKQSIYQREVYMEFSGASNCNLFNRSPHGVPFGSGCRPVTRK